ncbi:uncharacterized protein M6B38_257825 [Iris pallida]|uniref:F-box domain-containing protein n=1 Tax=Iris pallida TaxID=29817 RepID=A0AAX6IGH0_IRIPA|nr:uncharacterized protein M6B38_257825 [Iris pallida]
MRQQRKKRPRENTKKEKEKEKNDDDDGGGVGSSFRRWAELPDLPLESILRRLPSITDNLSFSSVCRSWRSLSTSTNTSFPPLLLIPAVDRYSVSTPTGPHHFRFSRRWNKPQRYLLQTLTKQTLTPHVIPSETLTLPFLGYSCNRLIFLSSSARSNIVIADVFTGQITSIRSPPAASLRPRTALLTETDLILAADSLLLSYRLGTDSWSRLDGAHVVSLLVFRGQIFSVDQSRGLGVIELTGTSIHWKPMELEFQGEMSYHGERPCGYSGATCNKFRQRLVQCGHELLYIKFVSLSSERRILILRVDLENLLLAEVDNLGDWCLFVDALGSCGMACPEPARWGGISNCLYMAWPTVVVHLDGDRLFDTDWDMDWDETERSESIFGENFPDDFIHEPYNPVVYSFPLSRWPSPVWVYPPALPM